MEAKAKIENNFLLLYSDNFLVFDLKNLIDEFNNSKKTLTFTITEKEYGNVILNQETKNVSYFRNKLSRKDTFVELGFMIVNKKKLFSYLGHKNEMFSISELISSNLGYYLYKGAYYSISDPERYFLTEKYLKNKKILLLDRDGTINVKAKKARYVKIG